MIRWLINLFRQAQPTCQSCRFGTSDELGWEYGGKCCRMPPQSIVAPTFDGPKGKEGGDIETIWPEVGASSFCGEWRKK